MNKINTRHCSRPEGRGCRLIGSLETISIGRITTGAISDDRLKVSLRLDGHNLPWKRPNLAAPNTTYNLNSVTSFAWFTGVLGDFSNFGTGRANVQASIRLEF